MNRQQSQSAKHRRQKGLRRDNSVPVIVADPHPNLGGLGYPVRFRTTERNNHVAGNPTSASPASIQRWQVRLNPYVRTGNSR